LSRVTYLPEAEEVADDRAAGPEGEDDAGLEDDLASWYDEEEGWSRDGTSRRAPKPLPRARRAAPPDDAQGVEGLAEPAADAESFHTTYQPSRHEKTWLFTSLRAFYELNLITDVLASVKGGKEASVYRCRANPATTDGATFVAAKVYRPRSLRSLRNDKIYKEGRPVLTGEGRAVKKSDSRILRALGKKTEFGQQVAHSSWLLYEYTTLRTLHAAGGAVPAPFGVSENAILMGYEGDEHAAAPTLSAVSLDPSEARSLFTVTLRNVELLLAHGFVHGDLSAYNILYWNGRITLIDFPQVVNCEGNPHARAILERDVTRVCDYFARQGVQTGPPARLARRLWEGAGLPQAAD
jgi:Serine/threonine protein kinase involved in cell cycle control